MGKENLSLVHSQDHIKVSSDEVAEVDLMDFVPGMQLTSLEIGRHENPLTFHGENLLRVFLNPTDRILRIVYRDIKDGSININNVRVNSYTFIGFQFRQTRPNHQTLTFTLPEVFSFIDTALR